METINPKTQLSDLTVEQLLEFVNHINAPVDPEDRTILIDEVCAMTGLKKCSIYQRTSNGSIPHWRRGKRLYFSSKQITAWMRNPDRQPYR